MDEWEKKKKHKIKNVLRLLKKFRQKESYGMVSFLLM